MGQDIDWEVKGETHALNHDLTFSAWKINCVCHSIRSKFRVLGIYNFACNSNFTIIQHLQMQKVGDLFNIRYPTNLYIIMCIFYSTQWEKENLLLLTFSNSFVSYTRLSNSWTFIKGCVINLYFFAVSKEFKTHHYQSYKA